MAPAQLLDAAKQQAHMGQVDAAVATLKAAPKSAEASSLLCDLYASVDQLEAAIAACESAAGAAPSNSSYALALARAYGAKADHSGAITGMRLVGKIRGNFERAVQLDGNNVEALSDLGQFYVEAPGMVGGGVDKARALVPRLQAVSPARADRLSAMIAAKGKDDSLAEQQYKAEAAVAHSPEAYVDLASFYQSRKEWDKATANAEQALDRDPHHGPDTLDAARILMELKKDAGLVQSSLRSYLAAPQGKVARYAKADMMLAQSLQDAGDNAGAQAARAAASALAHDYTPTRQGLAR